MDGARRIVFVADDLGVTSGANAGIVRAAAAGLVREASLCVTGSPEVAAAGARAARAAGVGVGLHFSLSLGRARSGPIDGLTDAQGRFLPLQRALPACVRGRVEREALAREIEAQLDAAAAHAGALTHANGHHHAHCWPNVRELFFAAVARRGVRWTRLPREHRAAGGLLRPTRFVLGHLADAAQPFAERAGLAALPFLGIALERRADYARRFRAAAAALPQGTFEWMVHPREPDLALASLDPAAAKANSAARAELAALTDASLVAELRAHGVEPVAFADLAPPQ